MEIAIDARLARSAGHRTYLSNLIPRIARANPAWTLRLLGSDALMQEDWTRTPNIRVERFEAALYGAREQWRLPALAASSDVLWVPHYNVPLFGRAPLVATVHDMAHLRLPEYSGVMRRGYARAMFGAVRRRASVIFVSEFTRKEFASLVGVPARASTVVHEGVDPAWLETPADSSPEKRPYFLFVGSLKPHKNLPRLLEAFASIQNSCDAQLVVIGRSDGHLTGEADPRSLPAFSDRVTLLGHCDDATVRRYVRHAVALVFPSLYEGFGLPPLEAMAAGCPVLASDAASIPEVCGDGADYFDPLHPRAMATRMLEVAQNTEWRQTLVRRGRVRAAMFRWDEAAERTASVLRDTVTLMR